jgi:hypothetical protein
VCVACAVCVWQVVLVAGLEGVRDRFDVAMGSERGAGLADRLCQACVEFLGVDAAAISLILDGRPSGTFGASSPASRDLDEVQFTCGEGPCLDAVARDRAVLVPDLTDGAERRWPAYTSAIVAAGMRAVYALPVSVANVPAGALGLFRAEPGLLDRSELAGGLFAAELAALPLLDLLGADFGAALTDPASTAWAEVGMLSRAEVNQATGVLIAQLGIRAPDALVRLRAYAFAHDMGVSDVSRAILEHRLRLDADESWPVQPEPGDG